MENTLDIQTSVVTLTYRRISNKTTDVKSVLLEFTNAIEVAIKLNKDYINIVHSFDMIYI